MGFMNRPKDKKSTLVGIRFTPSQVGALKTAADAAGTTVSEHIRNIVLNDDLTATALKQNQLKSEAGHDTNT